MSYKPRYNKGDWIAVCDSCGRYFKASSLRKRWDGFMVCTDDWEPRHPQDYVRGKAEKQTPPWTRSKPGDSFVIECTTRSSIVGFASVGCMIAGNTVNPGLIPSSTFTL